MSYASISNRIFAAIGLAFAVFTPALAAETDQPVTEGDSRVYELQDSGTDTPPVNFRSNEDERYNTATQRDAEMFAEEYERERLLKEKEDEERLRNLDGFAAGSPYRPGYQDSNYR